MGDLGGKSWMEGATPDQMRGRSVLLFTVRQLPSVLAAIQLDAVATRLLLCTSDSASHLPAIVEEAQVDLIVSDESGNVKLGSLGVPVIPCRNKITTHDYQGTHHDIETKWVLSAADPDRWWFNGVVKRRRSRRRISRADEAAQKPNHRICCGRRGRTAATPKCLAVGSARCIPA
jgi:hypothetical protein